MANEKYFYASCCGLLVVKLVAKQARVTTKDFRNIT